MLALYRILMKDTEGDNARLTSVKSFIYALMYVDNGVFAGTGEEVAYACQQLGDIFASYKFEVQQVCTDDLKLQAEVDEKLNQNTNDTVNLLGMRWNKITDELSPRKLNLDPTATTKRAILSSVSKQYVAHGMQAPLLVLDYFCTRCSVMLH